jgi:hypothetical protein
MENAINTTNSVNVINSINSIEYWLTKNGREIIDCPHQPGNLRITKKACLKRHKASEKACAELINQSDLFLYTVGQGLLRCKNCSLVKTIPEYYTGMGSTLS